MNLKDGTAAASYIPPAKYPALHRAVLDACDARDGVKDSAIEDPTRCNFDPISIQCKEEDNASCLTPPQVETARRIYAGAGQYSISDSGALAYVPGGIEADKQNSLVHVDLKGNIQPVVDFKASFNVPRFSPDGKQIAYHTIGKQDQLWIYDRASGSASRLIIDGLTICSEWTPDGKHLAFNWSRLAFLKLYWQPTDRSSPMERLVVGEKSQVPGSFSPDGAILAFMEARSLSNFDILLLDMKSRWVTPFINSQGWEAFPAISPDGHWMAYASDESGRAEVWVRPFPGQGGKWKISSEGGTEPIWSKDGRQLYYREANRVWAVDIRTVHLACMLWAFHWYRRTWFFRNFLHWSSRVPQSRAAHITYGVFIFLLGAGAVNQEVAVIPVRLVAGLLIVSLVVVIGFVVRDHRRYSTARPQVVRDAAAESLSMQDLIIRWAWRLGFVLLAGLLLVERGRDIEFILVLPLSYATAYSICDLLSQSILKRRFNPPGRGDFLWRTWSGFALIFAKALIAVYLVFVILAASDCFRPGEFTPRWPWPFSRISIK